MLSFRVPEKFAGFRESIAPQRFTVRPATGKRAGGRRWEVATIYEGAPENAPRLHPFCGTKRDCVRYAEWHVAGCPGFFERLDG